MSMLRGITVQLHIKTQSGYDGFNRPTYAEQVIPVENVLVTPVSAGDQLANERMSGKQISYELCIPKGDANCWTDTKVEFLGQIWHTVGYPEEYIEELLPLDWNKKIRVERHE